MSKITGFNYGQPASRVYPLTAMYQENVIHPAGYNNCCFRNEWVLDYSYTYMGEYCVEELPWQPRQAMTAHLYPPGKKYFERYHGQAGTNCYFVFAGSSPVLDKMVDNFAGFAEIKDPQGIIFSAIKEGALVAAAGQNSFWKCCIALNKVMDILEKTSHCAHDAWRYCAVRGEVEEDCIRKALAFMERNYMNILSVSEIASAAGCSDSTLAHKFKKKYGESVLKRLQKIRIEQSLPHLERGISIKEAAAVAGFVNEFYYSRVFRKIMGVPPGAYRQIKEVF